MEKNNNRRNRSVLKSYFQKGDVPTEQQFAELIDSVSNIVEDGQVMRTPSGWAFFPGQAGHLDIGLYTEEPLTEVDIPTWTLAITPEKKLTVRNAKGEAVMEALQDKSIVLYGSLKVEDEITATAYQTAGGDRNFLTVGCHNQHIQHSFAPIGYGQADNFTFRVYGTNTLGSCFSSFCRG